MKSEAPAHEFQSAYTLVVFPSDEHRDSLLNAVAQAGLVPLHCRSVETAHEAIKLENIQVVICEDLLPAKALGAILKQAHSRTKPIPVIVTSRTGEWEEFLKALRAGAFDYLVLPPRLDEVSRVLRLALAEGFRLDTDQARSAETLISKGNALGLHIEDRWTVQMSEAASVPPSASDCRSRNTGNEVTDKGNLGSQYVFRMCKSLLRRRA